MDLLVSLERMAKKGLLVRLGSRVLEASQAHLATVDPRDLLALMDQVDLLGSQEHQVTTVPLGRQGRTDRQGHQEKMAQMGKQALLVKRVRGDQLVRRETVAQQGHLVLMASLELQAKPEPQELLAYAQSARQVRGSRDQQAPLGRQEHQANRQWAPQVLQDHQAKMESQVNQVREVLLERPVRKATLEPREHQDQRARQAPLARRRASRRRSRRSKHAWRRWSRCSNKSWNTLRSA
jgi:hypothetical protein